MFQTPDHSFNAIALWSGFKFDGLHCVFPLSLEHRTGGLDPRVGIVRINISVLTCFRPRSESVDIIIFGILLDLATTSGQSKMFVVVRIPCHDYFQQW